MVSKKTLLIIAGTFWFIAGVVLMFRGIQAIFQSDSVTVVNVLLTVVGAFLFYRFVFKRISTKYITRINEMPDVNYPFYKFLNFKSYIMMFLMIGLGVGLRVSGLVPISILMYFFPIMSSSLLVSALRFYRCSFQI